MNEILVQELFVGDMKANHMKIMVGHIMETLKKMLINKDILRENGIE